jgi:excisionase family DNA binding protein
MSSKHVGPAAAVTGPTTTSTSVTTASTLPRNNRPSAESLQPQRRLLTIQETATALSVSVPSVRRLIAAGHLPCIRFNRRLLVDTKDLDRFIEQSRQPPR